MTGILDTIDDATGGRCACGCGTSLAPDGPSAWFADDDCQQRWHEQHATDPDDVYARPSAAPYVGVDSAPWPLREPRDQPLVTPQAGTPLTYSDVTERFTPPPVGYVMRDIIDGLRTTAPDVEFSVGPFSIDYLTALMAAVYGTPPAQVDPAGPPYTHRIGGGTPTYTIIDEPYDPGFMPASTPWLADTPGDRRRQEQAMLAPAAWDCSPLYTGTWPPARTDDHDVEGVVRRLLAVAVGAGFDVWPPGAQQVRIYGGGDDGAVEIGTLAPDPAGNITMPSGRYTFAPRLCPEHARQAQADRPADPMLAAIEARRNRNTGPPPRRRAPRQIDPRGNR